MGTDNQTIADFPRRPISIIAPNSPDTPVDILARAIAPAMSERLGQPVLVSNKPGEGQRIAYDYVAREASPDGYTIACVIVATLATLPLVTKKFDVSPLEALPPLRDIAETKFVFGSSIVHPWKTFSEFVKHATEAPNRLTYGYPTPNIRLTIEALVRDLGIKVRDIEYSGPGDTYLRALVAGDIGVGVVGETIAMSFGEEFRALAVTGAERAVAFPDVPTFLELGYPSVRGLNFSFNVRAGVPGNACGRLYDAISHALQQPEVRSLLCNVHYFKLMDSTPDEAKKNLTEQSTHFASIAKHLGVHPQ